MATRDLPDELEVVLRTQMAEMRVPIGRSRTRPVRHAPAPVRPSPAGPKPKEPTKDLGSPRVAPNALYIFPQAVQMQGTYRQVLPGVGLRKLVDPSRIPRFALRYEAIADESDLAVRQMVEGLRADLPKRLRDGTKVLSVVVAAKDWAQPVDIERFRRLLAMPKSRLGALRLMFELAATAPKKVQRGGG